MSIADHFITQSGTPVVAPAKVPPLQNGDRLSRIEFERRYTAMPEVKRAELIEGIVYMPSLVSISHAQPHAMVISWIGYYTAMTLGLQFGDNATCRLDGINEPQPDAMLMLPSAMGELLRSMRTTM